MFDLPEGGDGAGEQILTLRQGKNMAAEFALTFCTLAAQTGWSDNPLKLHYRKGLNLELQAELTQITHNSCQVFLAVSPDSATNIT